MHITADQLDLLLTVTGADAVPLSFLLPHIYCDPARDTGCVYRNKITTFQSKFNFSGASGGCPDKAVRTYCSTIQAFLSGTWEDLCLCSIQGTV